jgi:hypothetical protein
VKYGLAAVYFLVAAMNFVVATLHFKEGSEGFGIMWSVTAGLWLGGGIIWAIAGRND